MAGDAPSLPAAERDPGIFFDGDELRVRMNTDYESKVVFITFSSRSERAARGGFRQDGFGERFLQSQRIPHICFINKANHWWQTAEFGDAVERIRSSGVLSRFDRIVTYGASMGGYGALLGADSFDADLCLAFSPQFRINGDLPLVPQWAADLRGRAIVHEPFQARWPDRTRIVLLLDPQAAVDRAHLLALRRTHGCDLVPVPMAMHSAALFLHEAGLLKDLVRAAADGSFTAAGTRRRIRAARRTSARYWQGLARYQARRGRSAAAARADLCALDLALEDQRWAGPFRDGQARRVISIALAQGRFAAAAAVVARYAAAQPDDAKPHMLASWIERTRGRARRAVREARRALDLAPRSAATNLCLSLALLESDHLAAARLRLDAAVKLRGASHRDWIEAAIAFDRAGSRDHALLAAAQAKSLRPGDLAIRKLVARLEAT